MDLSNVSGCSTANEGEVGLVGWVLKNLNAKAASVIRGRLSFRLSGLHPGDHCKKRYHSEDQGQHRTDLLEHICVQGWNELGQAVPKEEKNESPSS